MNQIKQFITVLFLFLCSQLIFATSIKQISVMEMVNNSEFIFEGKCVSSKVVQIPNSRLIKTVGTFEIIDVIKGEHSALQIQLEFLGGTINGKKLSVGEMRLPEIGDHGFYFVEKLDRNQINPLLGWEQGRIKIVKDANGIERVGTSNDKPIISIQTSGEQSAPAIRSTLRNIQQSRSANISNGVARGIQSSNTSDWTSAIHKEIFKDQIITIIQSQ